ncbi:hypothetical protein Tco_1269892 [Tanacetum coccineum]
MNFYDLYPITINPSAIEQIALDNALVAPEVRLTIGKCNSRIAFTKLQREATYQVTFDALKLSPCYPAFLITAGVLEIYMHQFWNTVTKVKDSSSYQFKLDNKMFRVNAESLYLNWSLITCINPGEHLKLSSTGAFSGKPLDLIPLGCQELKFCRGCIIAIMLILLKSFGKTLHSRSKITYSKESMPYPRFTKIIINHFISQNKSISLRNMINLHTARDDSLLGTLKYVSKIEEYQVYGALIPKEMLNEDILNSTAYHTYYAYASGAKELKKTRKFKKHASPKLKTIPVSPKEPTMKSAKKPEPVKKNKALAKGNGTDFESGVLNKQQRKISGIDEGTGTKLGVPDLPKYDSESEKGSWGDSGEEEDDDEDDTEDESDNDVNDDDDDDGNDDDDDNLAMMMMESSTKYDEEEEESERVFTPPEFVATNDEEKIDDEENMDEEDDDDVMKELYKEVNVNLGSKDVDMTDADQGRADHHNVSQELGFEQVEEDAYVTLQTYL